MIREDQPSAVDQRITTRACSVAARPLAFEQGFRRAGTSSPMQRESFRARDELSLCGLRYLRYRARLMRILL
eukprot:3281784-Prymnesium_polylepis.1